MSMISRLSNAWHVFRNDGSVNRSSDSWVQTNASYYRRDRHTPDPINARTLIASIYDRIANDCASVQWKHVYVDSNGNFLDTATTNLEDCLTLSANDNQNAREFRLDVVMSLLDEGSVAIVPTETNVNPETGAFDILSLQVGKITQWAPASVEVELYNPYTGDRQRIWFPKRTTAIVENPFYSVMNSGNSTLKRLINKMSLLDASDAKAASNSLDLIVQLPYQVRTDRLKQQASERLDNVVDQLKNSEYGIAYIDATEHVTQLSRPIQNNLQPQIEYLTNQLFSQLGMSPNIFNGTATESELLVYQTKVIEPILATITLEMTRKFLSKTARTQGQRIEYYADRFRLATIETVASTADVMSRNEIMSPNEFRSILGLKVSTDPKSDALMNRNMTGDTALMPSDPSMAVTGDMAQDPTDGGEYEMPLSQSGIKGQKWGVRNYQNKDGSLTAAGRARYAKQTREASKTLNSAAKLASDTRRVAGSFENRRYAKKHANEIKNMSNQDMQRIVSRKNLEDQYVDAMAPHHVSNGLTILQTALGITGSTVAIAAGIAALRNNR